MTAPTPDRRPVAGRYRLRSVLGSGSMGTVWSAYDEFLHRQVAVKEVRMPPGVPPGQIEELRERTLREARAIAVLSHPNVVILHDVVKENGDPYVVMELLPSRSLAGLLNTSGRLTVAQAAALGEAVAAALEAAHAEGITHRDVKPGNVLIAGDGRIKLTDFGIARNVSEATMTHTGMMLGSPAFIAPEVAAGGPVTYTADLWGLGTTLFAATEGHPPYDADGDPLETVVSVVQGEVPRPSAGPLAPVIRGLMTKKPSERMSLSEVRRRLYPLLTHPRHTLFPPELFAGDDVGRSGASETRVIPRIPGTPRARDRGGEGAVGPDGDDGALAADPGPLPFEPAASAFGSATGSGSGAVTGSGSGSTAGPTSGPTAPEASDTGPAEGGDPQADAEPAAVATGPARRAEGRTRSAHRAAPALPARMRVAVSGLVGLAGAVTDRRGAVPALAVAVAVAVFVLAAVAGFGLTRVLGG